jgi:hypothetical protein
MDKDELVTLAASIAIIVAGCVMTYWFFAPHFR